MKIFQKKTIFTLIAALILGVGLHFLFSWLPSPITALVSPVRESLWEHLKILLIPLLLSGLYLTHGRGLDGLAPWLLTLPIIGGAMLLLSYLYHVPFQGLCWPRSWPPSPSAPSFPPSAWWQLWRWVG